jgi:hypothetical protein
LHHDDGDGLRRSGLDCGDHARMAERRRIALLLQLEAHMVDAARGVHREHEREIDGVGLRAGG